MHEVSIACTGQPSGSGFASVSLRGQALHLVILCDMLSIWPANLAYIRPELFIT